MGTYREPNGNPISHHPCGHSSSFAYEDAGDCRQTPELCLANDFFHGLSHLGGSSIETSNVCFEHVPVHRSDEFRVKMLDRQTFKHVKTDVFQKPPAYVSSQFKLNTLIFRFLSLWRGPRSEGSRFEFAVLSILADQAAIQFPGSCHILQLETPSPKASERCYKYVIRSL